ncbi:MAG: SDR family NAD(P)-dependent oxidoreductase, partial [Chloroflexota bacterium]
MNKAVLIIGVGDGLGGALARRFAKAGFAVCVGRRKAEKLEPLCAEIRSSGGIVHPFGVDARQEEAVV